MAVLFPHRRERATRAALALARPTPNTSAGMRETARENHPAGDIRPCRDDERGAILAIVNEAAQVYRGVIPRDRWHEPYMPAEELARDVAAGVTFWGFETSGALIGIMGVQPVGDVHLIRHAYVSPTAQGAGVGSALLRHLRDATPGQMLVGTWEAAAWAIRFYQRHGFALVPRERIAPLLRAYWSIPDRQVETSVVLADPPLTEARDGPHAPLGG